MGGGWRGEWVNHNLDTRGRLGSKWRRGARTGALVVGKEDEHGVVFLVRSSELSKQGPYRIVEPQDVRRIILLRISARERRQ